MRLIKNALILGLLLVSSACTETVVIPQIGDMLTIIVNSSSETEAAKAAVSKANRICVLQNQKLKVIDLETLYQGADNQQQTLIKFAEKILPSGKTSDSYVPEKYTYKATLTFRCI